jgi:hypothetical protein
VKDRTWTVAMWRTQRRGFSLSLLSLCPSHSSSGRDPENAQSFSRNGAQDLKALESEGQIVLSVGCLLQLLPIPPSFVASDLQKIWLCLLSRPLCFSLPFYDTSPLLCFPVHLFLLFPPLPPSLDPIDSPIE